MIKQNTSIAFCGIDGSGKGTQINNVHNSLKNQNLDVLLAKLNYFPLNHYGDCIVKDAFLKLRSGIEILKYYSILRFKNPNYDFILHDRYIVCYLAYAYAKGINKVLLLKNCFDLLINEADLTIYFDIEVKEALQRIETRNRKKTRNENYETLSRAKEGYEILLARMKNIEIIQAGQSEEEVYQQVENCLVKKLKTTH